jgi:hypothetical protein
MTKVLSSGLPEHVDDDESLARFLTSSHYFSSNGIKPAAFLPNPKDGETSVFRHGGEPRASLWQIGNAHIAGERTLHGAAIFKARDVRKAMLDVTAVEPPARHANITGWPWSQADPDMGKAERKERAMQIAQHAKLLLPE